MFEHHVLLCVLSKQCSDMLYTCFHAFEQCLNSPPCGGVLFKHFKQCLDMLSSLSMRSNTIRTVFRHVILPFHAFEECSNSPPCSGVLFEHWCCLNTVWTVFRHVILPVHVFEQCSNSLPCSGVLFKHFVAIVHLTPSSMCATSPTTQQSPLDKAQLKAIDAQRCPINALPNS